MKKFLSNLTTVFLVLILLFLLFLAYGSLNNRWYRVIAIEGNSMSPTFWYGDLIVVTPPTANIPSGTIVTMNVDGSLVTHRLIADYNGNKPETKGDANEIPDNFPGSNLKIVGIERFHIPWLAYPFFFLRYLLAKI
jgi:signal peptidase I